MQVVAPRCAGLDVHRSMIAACALISDGRGRARKEMRQFVTTRVGLERLAGWLGELGVTHVGMESTGVYWMLVYAVLEAAGGVVVLLVNSQPLQGREGGPDD